MASTMAIIRSISNALSFAVVAELVAACANAGEVAKATAAVAANLLIE